MNCVSSVSYSVMVNGKIGERFKPNGRLCQRDPLSPFVFLICSERLSSLIRLALKEKRIKGTKASRYDLQISHLLFADESILFGEATEACAMELKRILKEYELCF